MFAFTIFDSYCTWNDSDYITSIGGYYRKKAQNLNQKLLLFTYSKYFTLLRHLDWKSNWFHRCTARHCNWIKCFHLSFSKLLSLYYFKTKKKVFIRFEMRWQNSLQIFSICILDRCSVEFILDLLFFKYLFRCTVFFFESWIFNVQLQTLCWLIEMLT